MTYRSDPQTRRLTSEHVDAGYWVCRTCGVVNCPDEIYCWNCEAKEDEQ